MSKAALQVVTANRLVEGDAVWLTPQGGWSPRHEDAAAAEDKIAAAALLAQAETQASQVVGPYLAPAERGPDGRPQPTHFREVFRTRGPSNRLDLGKQAEF